jgi:ankyrin repeat protein
MLLVLVFPLLMGQAFLFGGQSRDFRDALAGDAASIARIIQDEKERLETDHSGRTLFHWLVGLGNGDGVRQFLDAGVDVDLPLRRDDAVGPVHKGNLDDLELADVTPLTIAAFAGQLDVAQLLLDRGADINAAGSSGLTPILAASQWADEEMVGFLIERGASMDVRNRQGLTPLLLTVWGVQDVLKANNFMRAGNVAWTHPRAGSASKGATVDLLLANGADPASLSAGDETAIYLAAYHGDRELVDLLLAHGVDPNTRMNEGRNAAFIAAAMDHVDLAAKLVDHGAEAVTVGTLIRDVHATAVLHDLVGQREEQTGSRSEAVDHYLVAADYFKRASIEFRTEADRRIEAGKRAEFWSGIAQGAFQGLVATNAQIQARQNAQLFALVDAAGTGTGLGGYYSMLDRDYGSASMPAELQSYTFNQQLPADQWIEVYAARSVLAQRAAAQIHLRLEESYVDLLPARPYSEIEAFLLRSRTAWLRGALSGISEDYQRDAAVGQEDFIALYSPEISDLALQATTMRPVSESEFLVGYSAGEYFLTSETLYVVRGDAAGVYPIDEIVDYRVEARRRRVEASFAMNDGRSISLDSLSLVPSVEAIDIVRNGQESGWTFD